MHKTQTNKATSASSPRTHPARVAVIDIGSNSIRTMTAESGPGGCRFSAKAVHTTRLAEGLLQTGLLTEARMAESLAVIGAFVAQMRASGIPVYAYATSAVRDAQNGGAFAKAVRACTGGQLAVLSGEQEARYAYLAATSGDGGMLDIGGGSTQIVTKSAARSFPLGCVRAKDLCPGASFETIRTTLNARLDDIADVRGIAADRWTGVGGSITTLAALQAGCTVYDCDRVNGFVLEPAALTALLGELDAMGGARAGIPLLEKRHDVILYGGAILLYFMERLNIARLRVSDADGLEGYATRLLRPDAEA